ncbi:RHS repeat-associated core domain-containing protein [Thalassotalea euphylliae]|nr:RHS repeat-associated core domain-containing protein [Thalassotalea euphylliae]
MSVSETTENTALFKWNYPADNDHQNLKAQLGIYDSNDNVIARTQISNLHSISAGFISQHKENISNGNYYAQVAIMLRGDSSKLCALKSNTVNISQIIVQPNESPEHIRSSVSSNEINVNENVTFTSVWKDQDSTAIVNVKARYRKTGTTPWTEVVLDDISGNVKTGYTFNKSITMTAIGQYEVEFQASDNDGNTANYQGRKIFTVVEESNSAPTLNSSSASPTSVTVDNDVVLTSVWKDSDSTSIIDVKARYRKTGTSSWAEVVLNAISGEVATGYTFNKAVTMTAIGQYEVEFQASDNDSNTTSYQGRKIFTVVEESNSAPTLNSSSVTPAEVTLNDIVTLASVWQDQDSTAIINVKARYRKIGTTSWTELVLDAISGSVATGYTFNKAVTMTAIGQYEVEFQASDNDGNTASYQGRKEFLVRESASNVSILKVNLSGQGKIHSSLNKDIDCGSKCSYQYENNSQVTLVAVAEEGWKFSSWSYQPTQTNQCTTATCSLVIKEDLTLTAVFIEQETPTTDPRLIDFSPKRAVKGSSTTFTLVGENLPEQIIANIQGTLGHCTDISSNGSTVTLTCTPDEQGAKRFYIKDASDKNQPIAGSEHWYVEVTPAVQGNAPSVWIDNLPDYVTLDEQFTLIVKSEDVDGDLVSIQADWEGDNNLDRKVNVSNPYGQDIVFSYTRSNNDLSDLTLKFIATDESGNESTFKYNIPVVQSQETEEVVSGYEGAELVRAQDQCTINAAALSNSNPIIPSNGAKVEYKQLLTVNGVVPVTFDISYNSLIRGQSGIGIGWDFANAYAAQIAEAANGDITILWSDNQQHKFSPKGDGTYNTESFGCRLDKLRKLENGTFSVERRNRLTYVFNEFNFLTRIENHKGQGVNFEFDEQSRLKKAYDPISNAGINYIYNQDGFLVKATSTAGRTVNLNYEDKRLTKITHADGTVEEFTYNALDQIVDHFLDTVLVSSTKYDNKGRAIEQEDSRNDNEPLRLAYQETYEQVITTITDRNGKITQKTFDKNYQLVKEVNALSHEQNFEYNQDGKPTLVTNGRGYSTSMAYTQFGDVTDLSTPDGAIDKNQYDNNRNLIRHANALGEETLYSYVEGTNNIATITNALGLTTSFTYDENNQQTSITTPEGRTTYFTYTNGLLTSETNPEGDSRNIYYDLDGFIESETDFQGNTTTYERDGLGRVTRKQDPLNYAETWTYDARGNVLEYGDKRYNSEAIDYAGKFKYSYNGQGDLLEKRWVSKHYSTPDVVHSYKYDGESRLIESTDPNGNITVIKRDALGRVIETTDALGNKVAAKFDENGNLIESSDAKGNTSKVTFDAMDRTTQTEDAAGNKQSSVYNLLGQITKTTNALSQVWHSAYDKLSRLISITHPSNPDEPLVAKQSYDKDNNVTGVTAPADDTRTLDLNNNAQVETETTADNVALQYAYNENGLVSTFINGRNQQTSYQYDGSSRLISVTDPISTVSYGLDANSNPISIVENSVTISRLYDSFNRVGQYKQNADDDQRINFAIDDVGNVTQLQYLNNNQSLNTQIKYTHNALNLVTSVSKLGSNDIAAEYEYDANQNITKVTRGNGTVLENTYDNLNRLTSSIDKAPDGTVILEQHYTYNAIGQVIKEDISPEFAPPVELLTQQVMTYSADNRIASKNSETFDFDLDGNTLNVGDLALSFNARNQLTSAGNHQYTYNAEGMRDTQTYSDDSGETQIRYALLPDYIGLPQIAWQQVTNPDDSVDYHYFIYSPYGLVSQRTSKANQAAQDYYFHYDYRSSVVAISDQNGDMVARYGYTPFGTRFDAPEFAEQNQAITTPFGYNGRDGVITDNNGLIYMRARYYSPELRRFVSKDPIRGDISDLGSLNRYAYVGGDPVNLVDPSGQAAETAWDIANVLIGVRETYNNIEQGKYWSAAGSAFGTALDGCAAVFPFVPGGASTLIKANKYSKKVASEKSVPQQVNPNKRSYNSKERNELYDKYDGKCYYCEIQLQKQKGSPTSLEADHVKAYIKGGKTTIKNGAASCRSCNRKKGKKDFLLEWMPPKLRYNEKVEYILNKISNE